MQYLVITPHVSPNWLVLVSFETEARAVEFIDQFNEEVRRQKGPLAVVQTVILESDEPHNGGDLIPWGPTVQG